MWRDSIAPQSFDPPIAGERIDFEVGVDAPIRSRLHRDRSSKPAKCRPHLGLTAAWTRCSHRPLLSPAAESRRAVIDYRRAMRNIFGRVG